MYEKYFLNIWAYKIWIQQDMKADSNENSTTLNIKSNIECRHFSLKKTKCKSGSAQSHAVL